MKKKYFTLFVSLLIYSLLNAQSGNEEVKTKVNELLSQLKKQTFDVTFTLVYSNAEKDIHDIQYGKCLMRGVKFHLSMSGIDTYFDGKTQWVYSSADNEVTITEPEKNELKDISPLAMVEYYCKNHRIVKDTEHRTNDNYYLNFYPEDQEAEHFKISMVITSNNMLTKLTIHQKNGDTIMFNWDDINKKNSITNNEFIFDKTEFPNLFVNDMR